MSGFIWTIIQVLAIFLLGLIMLDVVLILCLVLYKHYIELSNERTIAKFHKEIEEQDNGFEQDR